MEEHDALEAIKDDALQEFPTDWPGSGECQRIVRDWFDRLQERAGEDTSQFERDVWDAVRILEEIRLSMSPIPEDDAKYVPFRIWAWPNENNIRTPPSRWLGRSPVSVDQLDEAIAKYLKRPWLQHDVIDASVINALLFNELAEFSEQVRIGAATGMPNWSYIFSDGNEFAELGLALAFPIVGFLARWVMLPAVALGFLIYGFQTAAIVAFALWALYVLYRIIVIPARWRLRKARRDAATYADKIIRAMLNAWGAARGSTINPSRLKELVMLAEERGAVYRPVLHTLIDRAIQRDPTALATE